MIITGIIQYRTSHITYIHIYKHMTWICGRTYMHDEHDWNNWLANRKVESVCHFSFIALEMRWIVYGHCDVYICYSYARNSLRIAATADNHNNNNDDDAENDDNSIINRHWISRYSGWSIFALFTSACQFLCVCGMCGAIFVVGNGLKTIMIMIILIGWA